MGQGQRGVIRGARCWRGGEGGEKGIVRYKIVLRVYSYSKSKNTIKSYILVQSALLFFSSILSKNHPQESHTSTNPSSNPTAHKPERHAQTEHTQSSIFDLQLDASGQADPLCRGGFLVAISTRNGRREGLKTAKADIFLPGCNWLVFEILNSLT